MNKTIPKTLRNKHEKPDQAHASKACHDGFVSSKLLNLFHARSLVAIPLLIAIKQNMRYIDSATNSVRSGLALTSPR